jgi:DUF1680 family protein
MVATVTTRRAVGEELGHLHDTIWLHQLAAGEMRVELPSGGAVTLAVRGRYPWDGEVEVEVTALEEAGSFTLNLRIPGWCDGASAEVNGAALTAAETAAGQYATLNRTWAVGDVVTLHLPLRIRRLEAHPRVTDAAGRVALMRGPLLYCVEAADNPRGDVRDLVLTAARDLHPAWQPEELGGCVAIGGTAELERPEPEWEGALYREMGGAPEAARAAVKLRAVPYFLWANRGRGPMTVWLRRE